MECNIKPSLGGAVMDAITRRFINIVFRAKFTSDETLLDRPNHFRENLLYKSGEWKQQHKYALFDYLMTYTDASIYVPDCIRKATADYLGSVDDFTCWADQHYVEGEGYISIREMMENYKCTFLKQGSRAYKSMTMNKFKELLQENMVWGTFYLKYYTPRHQPRVNGIQQDLTDVLVGITYVKDQTSMKVENKAAEEA